MLYPLIQRFSKIFPPAGWGQWEPPTKETVSQVASEAGHLCPYLTGSPCIACALNSPVSSAFTLYESNLSFFFFLNLVLILFNPLSKKLSANPSSLCLSPRLIHNVAVRVNRFTVSCLSGEDEGLWGKASKSRFTACFIPRKLIMTSTFKNTNVVHA